MLQTNTAPVIPIPQRREGDLTNIRLKIAFISNHRRRPQQRQDLFETIVCSCMHTHERCVLLHALADFFKSEMPTAKSILSSTCCRPPPSKNEARSEERRVGKETRSGRGAYREK